MMHLHKPRLWYISSAPIRWMSRQSCLRICCYFDHESTDDHSWPEGSCASTNPWEFKRNNFKMFRRLAPGEERTQKTETHDMSNEPLEKLKLKPISRSPWHMTATLLRLRGRRRAQGWRERDIINMTSMMRWQRWWQRKHIYIKDASTKGIVIDFKKPQWSVRANMGMRKGLENRLPWDCCIISEWLRRKIATRKIDSGNPRSQNH